MSLAQLLKLERPLILFDLETTGLNVEEARIVELAHEVHRPDGTVSVYRTLINPGVPLGESSAIHGITEADLLACQACGKLIADHVVSEVALEPCTAPRGVPKFINLAPNLARGYSNCDFAGKNIRYDLRVMNAEFKRVGIPWSYVGAAVLDADRLEAALEPRDLSSLYRRRLGREPEGAHRADNDVRMTREILEDQLTKGGDILPLDLRRLHELQWPGWLDAEGKFRRVKSGAVEITFGKHVGTDVRRVPRSYLEWMAGPKGDFQADTKKLALQMVGGVFP